LTNRAKPYKCTADDAAYATFELEGGVIAHFNSSWVTRVRRDDLLTLHIDGTKGSAVAGLRECWTQHYGNTPKPVWNPDIPNPINFYEGWSKVPEQEVFDNAFKAQWELFPETCGEKRSFSVELNGRCKRCSVSRKRPGKLGEKGVG
jgi:predicted dehydrogenase